MPAFIKKILKKLRKKNKFKITVTQDELILMHNAFLHLRYINFNHWFDYCVKQGDNTSEGSKRALKFYSMFDDLSIKTGEELKCLEQIKFEDFTLPDLFKV